MQWGESWPKPSAWSPCIGGRPPFLDAMKETFATGRSKEAKQTGALLLRRLQLSRMAKRTKHILRMLLKTRPFHRTAGGADGSYVSPTNRILLGGRGVARSRAPMCQLRRGRHAVQYDSNSGAAGVFPCSEADSKLGRVLFRSIATNHARTTVVLLLIPTPNRCMKVMVQPRIRIYASHSKRRFQLGQGV